MKKLLAVIICASALLRVWFVVDYWSQKPLTHDAHEYLELARNFNRTGEFAYAHDAGTTRIESYGRAPGYPFWLSLLLRVSSSLVFLRLADAFLNLVVTGLFFLIAREMLGTRAGVAALALSSFYPPLLAMAPVMLSENLWLVLVLFSYWALLRCRKDAPSRNAWLLLAFVILALATLVRPAACFLVPFFLTYAVRLRSIRAGIAAFALYTVVLLPWNLSLYHRSGHFIFIASEGGVSFWTGTHPLYSGDGDLAVNPAVQTDYRKLLAEHAAATSEQREQIYKREAFRNVTRYPGAYLQNEAKKLLFWVLPFGRSITRTSSIHRVTAMASYLLLLILGVSGWLRAGPGPRWFLAGIAASFTLMILLFFPQERFRIACLDPVLILSASALAAVCPWLSRLSPPSPGAGARATAL
jgi:4-amino-4-deoxy-L-arabinose transferase-like glycosyltransferase